MHARLASIMTAGSGAQQKDNLCGAFWGARVLNESGFSTWDGEAIDEDLIALRAGTVLPDEHTIGSVPPGADSLTAYRYALPRAPVEQSGTSASRLADTIEAASSGELVCVPLRGSWNVERIERLVDESHQLGARLIANLRTGPLWGSRPPTEVLLAELEGRPVEAPAPDWDVGHYVELEMLIRGPAGALVVVHDSYPSFGWNGRHLQPPRVLVDALMRGDGREGGVLVVVPRKHGAAAKAMAAEIGLEVGTWNNGTRS